MSTFGRWSSFVLFLSLFAGVLLHADSALAQACSAQGLRLGGEPGDTYIGPTCNSDDTHRTCFYVTGENLPAAAGEFYKIFIDGVPYTLSLSQQLSPTEVVACTTDIPSGGTGLDVEVQLEAGCGITVADLYDAPDCSCTISSIRLGGEPGDAYVGPTCNSDDTHRTCLYVSGTQMPAPTVGVSTILIGGVEYPLALGQVLSPTEVVACATGMPDGTDLDVEVRLSPSCVGSVPDLYDSPICSCIVDTVRLGGAEGDSYVGPTCNGDGTYRTCYYAEGNRLVAPADPYYQVQHNGDDIPVAFEQLLDPGEAVACVTGLSPYVDSIDVAVAIKDSCTGFAPALHAGTDNCSCLTDPDEAAACAAGEVLLTVEKVIVSNDGGELQLSEVELLVNGAPVNPGEANSFPPGTYTVSETEIPGYAVTFGGDCAADGTITLELGPPKTCTVTNDDIAPRLTVVKNLLPETDPGRFSLWISDAGGVVASVDDVGDGGVLGPVELSVGDYTVGEDGFGGTDLGDYATAIGGDCAADGSISLALADEKTCTVENGRVRLNVWVEPDFSDDNPAFTEVRLTCNSGLPLQQSFTIAEGHPVNFVVTSFLPGELDCRIERVGEAVEGYAAAYTAGVEYGGADAVRSESDGCYFDGIAFGQFTCDLTQTLLPVEVVVSKEWTVGDGRNDIDFRARAGYTCYDVWVAPDILGQVSGDLLFEGSTDSETITGLLPNFDGSSYCDVRETAVAHGVEADDSDCQGVPVAPGQDGACTLHNTVFFEGIPALDRLALLMLGLVMLGAGLVAVRRIA